MKPDLETFARLVLRTADALPSGRTTKFGDKALISAIWEAYEPPPSPAPGLTDACIFLITFKSLLVECNSKGLLRLSRIDLPQFVASRVLIDSEIRHGDVRWHAVVCS